MAGIVDFEGCRFSYELTGEGAPLVLVQGVGVSGSGWAPQVQELSSRYHCLTFDNRGLGRSQPLGRSPSVAQMARDVLHLMSHVGWRTAHVAGHSLGGPIAMQMAFDAPARIRSLSLLCTVGRGRDATRLSARMLKLGLLSRIGPRRSRRRAFLRIVMPDSALLSRDPDAIASNLESLFGHDLADQPPVAMKQLKALRAFNAGDALRRLDRIPTLVVSAEHDPIAPPRFGRALAVAIPGARYEEIPDASHGVTIHRAGQVNLLLREHLDAAEAVWHTGPPSELSAT